MGRGALASIVLLAAVAVAGPAEASVPPDLQRRFEEGIRLHEEGRHREAVLAWREILDRGFASAPLLSNLGHASYRSGEIGWSVYYYELARRLAPGDPDIKSDLAWVKREALGPEGESRPSRLLSFIVGMQDRATAAQAAWGVVVAIWLASVCLLLLWLRPMPRLFRTLPWFAVAALGLAGIVMGAKGLQGALAPDAIAVRPLAVRTLPSEDATVEFRLPAGSPVSLGRTARGWREIVVSTHLRGWVPEEHAPALALR